MVVTSLAVCAAGLWLLSTVDAATTVPWGVLGPLAVFAVGMATFTAPVATAAMSALDDRDQGWYQAWTAPTRGRCRQPPSQLHSPSPWRC